MFPIEKITQKSVPLKVEKKDPNGSIGIKNIVKYIRDER